LPSQPSKNGLSFSSGQHQSSLLTFKCFVSSQQCCLLAILHRHGLVPRVPGIRFTEMGLHVPKASHTRSKVLRILQQGEKLRTKPRWTSVPPDPAAVIKAPNPNVRPPHRTHTPTASVSQMPRRLDILVACRPGPRGELEGLRMFSGIVSDTRE